MGSADAAIAVILALFALRGFWRGFFRESFGLAGLIVGVLAALRFTEVGEAALQPYLKLPPPIPAGIAFVAIFVVVHTALNLLGVLLDWAAGASVLRRINDLAGAVLGVAKGAVVLAVVFLFLHLFPIAGTVEGHIMRSSLGRPLVAAASAFLRLGLKTGPEAPTSGQT
jgi:membrane protein required for colicin V production